MGLLEKEIQELRVLNKRLDEGTIKPEDLHAKIAVYSQVEKRAKMLLQAMALGAKYGGGKTAFKKISDSNLIGGSIDMESSPADQLVACPDLDKVITRNHCLDYSESAEHCESCKSCKEFGVTRSMLLKK